MDNLDQKIKGFLLKKLVERDSEAENEVVPPQAIARAKALGVRLRCPHCGRGITPFKRPVRNQQHQIALWIGAAGIFFAISFFVPRYFLQFLVLAVLCGVKVIVDSRSLKSQILIYQALRDEERDPLSRGRVHLHHHES